MNLEEQVLDRIKPGAEDQESINKTVRALVERVMETDAAGECEFEPYLVGSIAKNTYLKDPDADLFLLFDPDTPREELEHHGLAIGREAIDGREHYAEHPYIKGRFMGLRADIVPAYKVVDGDQRMSAVDRTPFHTEYVKNNLKAELQDHVRLLKGFMKGIGTYSAEARVMGFSGYLCELLVIKYGGFNQTLGAAGAWSHGERLELGTATKAEFKAPLTFIDPVDASRNVSSAVSEDSLAVFIAASRDYLHEPTMKFFFPGPLKTMPREDIISALGPRGDIISISLERPDIIDDILYPQLRKFQKNSCQMLEGSGFVVTDSVSCAIENEMTIIIELETGVLPEAKLHSGPPAWIEDNSRDFLEKWRGHRDSLSAPFIREGRWHVVVKRKHRSALELIRSGISGLDMGKDLNCLKESVRISEGLPGSQTAREAFSEYLDRELPWRR